MRNKLTIVEGFQSWLDDAPDGDTGRSYQDHVRIFLRYLRKAKRMAPSKDDWSEVTKGRLLVSYRKWLEGQGLSLSTIKHRLFVLNAAMRHVFEVTDGEYRCASIRARPQRVKHVPVKTEHKILSMEQVGSLLNRAKQDQYLYGPILLQVSAGLRCMEAFNVRCNDIDFERQTVRICATEHHTPKNVSSIRTIPVGPFVMSELASIPYIESWGTWPITSPKSNLGAVWGYRHYGRAVRAVMLNAGIGNGFQTRWLRATFASNARNIGCERVAIQVYMGHRIPDVFGDHYEYLNEDHLREVVAIPMDSAVRKAVGL